MAPELSIAVPTFDRRNGRVDRLLASIEAYTSHVEYEVVVSDCEGRLEGYTAPMNRAMAQAKGRLVLSVNDDVEVSPGWYEPLAAAIDAGAWCATPDASASDGIQIYAPYCALWRRDAWEAIGGLDERYVHWCSDIDMAARLVEAGHRPVKVVLPIPIRHELNATSREHPSLGPICVEDLARFAARWGRPAEEMKAALVMKGSE